MVDFDALAAIVLDPEGDWLKATSDYIFEESRKDPFWLENAALVVVHRLDWRPDLDEELRWMSCLATICIGTRLGVQQQLLDFCEVRWRRAKAMINPQTCKASPDPCSATPLEGFLFELSVVLDSIRTPQSTALLIEMHEAMKDSSIHWKLEGSLMLRESIDSGTLLRY